MFVFNLYYIKKLRSFDKKYRGTKVPQYCPPMTKLYFNVKNTISLLFFIVGRSK